MNNEQSDEKQVKIENADREENAVASSISIQTKESAQKVEKSPEAQKGVESQKDRSGQIQEEDDLSGLESEKKKTESGEKVQETTAGERAAQSLRDRDGQVRLKTAGDHLLLMLPPEREFSGNWNELWQELQVRLKGGARFWQANSQVHLMARERLLDGRQLQAIADALSEVQLQLKRVETSRRQTAVAAATSGYSVEQISPHHHLVQAAGAEPLAEPLYMETTVRSGVEIRHQGNVVILGDINPGGKVISVGDILVWGRLRGVAHAGSGGNSDCVIMALQMEPTQLRIANYLARAPQQPPAQYYPEVAYATTEGIRIARATDFTKKPTDEQQREKS